MKSTKPSVLTLAVGMASLTVLGLTSACGNSITPTDDITVAVIGISVDPDPVSSQVSTDPEFDFVASFIVTLTETTGTGAAIDSVSVDVTETSDGEEVVTDEEPHFRADVSQEADRVEGNASTQIAFDIYYTLPGGGSESRIDIALSITDDYGFEAGGELQVRVDQTTST